MDRRHRIKGYLAFHSFGNLIVYPWGHTSEKTKDWKDLRTFAKVAADAIERNSDDDEQERSFSDFFLTDPIVSKYSVSQQSVRYVPLTTIGSLKNTISRILAEEVITNKSRHSSLCIGIHPRTHIARLHTVCTG